MEYINSRDNENKDIHWMDHDEIGWLSQNIPSSHCQGLFTRNPIHSRSW
jgi:hypothetical protein